MLSVSMIGQTLFAAVLVFTWSQLLSPAQGQPQSNPGTSFITVFEVQCDSGRCPRDIAQATADKVAGRAVADQCCVYFRDGCCTAEENSHLTSLFQLTLGLCIGIPLLVVVVIVLVVILIIYCKLRYSRMPHRNREKRKSEIFQSTSATSSIDYWRSSGDDFKPKSSSKALFHF